MVFKRRRGYYIDIKETEHQQERTGLDGKYFY